MQPCHRWDFHILSQPPGCSCPTFIQICMRSFSGLFKVPTNCIYGVMTLSYLVIYQQVRSWVRVGQSGDGLGLKSVFSELRLIPAPALDAGETAAALALRRVNLDNSRRCHFRREAMRSSRRPPPWLAQAPLCNVPEPAAGRTYNVPGSSWPNRKRKCVLHFLHSPTLGRSAAVPCGCLHTASMLTAWTHGRNESSQEAILYPRLRTATPSDPEDDTQRRLWPREGEVYVGVLLENDCL